MKILIDATPEELVELIFKLVDCDIEINDDDDEPADDDDDDATDLSDIPPIVKKAIKELADLINQRESK